jgi:uncharacterized hydrophobic protein (TIGR00341 family)
MLNETPHLQIWHDDLQEGATITKVLLDGKEIDHVLEILQGFYKNHDSLRVVILPVEATIPRPEEPDEEEIKEEKKNEKKSPDRISIEELYQKMTAYAGVSRKFIVMAMLASFVAAIGLLKNDAAVIIGSMVIAPLLSPNMALSLATTLADSKLAGKAIRTNIIGFFLVLSIGMVMGFFMDVNPTIPQIASRSDISHLYIFLALAAGVAGAYSMTTGVAEALVGVMVAVALSLRGRIYGRGYGGPPTLFCKRGLCEPLGSNHFRDSRDPAPAVVGGAEGQTGGEKIHSPLDHPPHSSGYPDLY